MNLESITALGEIMVKISGPLMLAMVVFMYVSVYIRTGKRPKPTQAMYEYAKLNLRARNHAGILVYGFIACLLIFMAGVAALLYARVAG